MEKIQYQIKDEQLYIGDGENKLSQIKNKMLNKPWRTSFSQDKLQLVFLFKQKTLVMQVQIKLIDVQSFSIDFFDSDKKKKSSHKYNLNQSDKDKTIKINVKQGFQCSYANLTLQNNIIDPKQMGIRFVYFSGFVQGKNQKNKKNKKDMKEFTKEVQNKYSAKKQDRKKQQIFQNRAKTSKQNLLNLTDFYQFEAAIQGSSGKRGRGSSSKPNQHQNNSQKKSTSKKIKKNHDAQSSEEVLPQKRSNRKKNNKTHIQKDQEELDLAIAISKSQAQGKFIDLQQGKVPQALMQYEKIVKDKQSNKIIQESYLDQFQYEHFSNRVQYEIMEYSRQSLKQLENVNQSWLQAQKQAEMQKKVQQHHRLSSYIKVKHLYQTSILVTGFSQQNNKTLRNICRQLGAQIIQNVKNHCLVITTKLQAQKLHRKHKQLKDVKYINEDYIHECIKYNSKLKPSDYYIKL